MVSILMMIFTSWMPFFAFATSFDASQVPQICLESADHDLSGSTSYNPAVKKQMNDKVGAANFLLDSAHLDQKIKAYQLSISDPNVLLSLKQRLYEVSLSEYNDRVDVIVKEFNAIDAHREAMARSRDALRDDCKKQNSNACLKIKDLENQIDQALSKMMSIHQELEKMNESNILKKDYLNKMSLDVPQWLEKTANSTITFPTELPSNTDDKLSRETKVTEIFANAKAKFANHACYLVLDPNQPDSRKRLDGCLAAASYLVEQSAPHEVSGEQAAFYQIIRKVLTEPVYTKAAAKMAVKLVYKVNPVLAHPENFDSSSQNFGDFFEDMVAAFSESDPSASNETNKDRAFDLLALYGTRGAGFSFLMYVSQKENLTLSPSLNIIATVSNILNRASLHSGKMYAFPAFVQSDCAVGRPYHFWMAASLARMAVKIGKFEKVDIFAAIHALRVAYKLLGPSSVWQTFFIPELKAGYTVELQKDLVFGALGAYGILRSHNLDFSDVRDVVHVDSILAKQISAANFEPSENQPSILDNLPFYLRTFATSSFTYQDTSEKTIERADRAWTAGIAPNVGYELLRSRLIEK